MQVGQMSNQQFRFWLLFTKNYFKIEMIHTDDDLKKILSKCSRFDLKVKKLNYNKELIVCDKY